MLRLISPVHGVVMPDESNVLLPNLDVMDGLQSVIGHRDYARLIFADPPYNIGIDYYGLLKTG